jgi:sigma-B regulation protein RsbU (phosphoserine phosphatase)
MMPGIEFKETTVPLSNRNKLYVFSDGVYEIPQENDNIWGFNALIDTFIRTSSDRNSRIEHILTCVKAAANNRPFEDDLSLLEIEFHI